MTVQQQLAARVMNLSDEGARLVGQFLSSLNPLFFIECGTEPDNADKLDVSKRFGAGKGIIQNTDKFDSFNGEIAEIFEGFHG